SQPGTGLLTIVDENGTPISPCPPCSKTEQMTPPFQNFAPLVPRSSGAYFPPPRFYMTTNAQHGPQKHEELTSPRVIQSASPDLRTMVRHLLHARVIFGWNDDDGPIKGGPGKPQNISQNGAYVVPPEPPPIGSHISMSIYLP